MTSASLSAGSQASRIDWVVETGVRPEKLVSGFEFVEGPVWLADENTLLFSDIIGDTMYCWNESDGLSQFRKPSHMANGNTLDLNGRLLSCEHATSRLSRTDKHGNYEVLASHYNGRELNSPNDVVVHSRGSIYFTDPNSGRGPRYGVERQQELDFQGVYKFDPDSSELSLLVDDFSKPNGLCFSPNESQLYINDTDRQHIRVFDLLADGRIGNGRIWAETGGHEPGVADGMKFDSAGHLYSCGSGGIHVFNRDARRLGIIELPEVAANFCWGGVDLRDLFVTATHSIYRIRMRIPGREVHA